MTISDIVYLLVVTIGMAVFYFLSYYFFYFFFKNSKPPTLAIQTAIRSLFYIVAFSLAVYFISYNIPSLSWGNRIIHTFGGGFLAYLTCFLAVKDSRLKIGRIRFFIFSALLVVALGVFNEIAEFVLQNYFNFWAAPTINDTWLDLISNSVGILLSAICFTPFLKK